LRATGRLLLISGLLLLVPCPAFAQHIGEKLASQLSEEQQRGYLAYLRARAAYDKQLDGYWDDVDDKRDARRRKRASGQAFTAADYVSEQPPKYTGPPIPSDVARVIAAQGGTPAAETEPRAGVADFLTNARVFYGFVPASTSEAEFKRSYARHALAAGLTKMQVVRVYALETGGRGTYDMQAGIDPETKQGKPISSALGYAQLLNGNSISELVRHGGEFIERLRAMAVGATDGRRAADLRAKAAAVGKMLRVAKSVPNEWSHHVKLGNTPRGYGIHALNLDADIGPWLQVVKLKGVLQAANNAGLASPSGAELELMNLAGPRTGLEMMEPAGRNAPTSNFFSRTGYYRNTIVRERTGAELLAVLGERMEVHLKKPGAQEFIGIFDEVMKQQRQAGR
jgi:hypothetical protein